MKKKILFVDDEANVLDGLRRILRDMRREWEMEFASSGEQAIEILGSIAIDVVVTDMRMPGMDGRRLLEKVKQSYPQIVRIILSGYSEKDLILSSVGLAHQFLSKPCDIETLRATVARACAMRELLEDQYLIELVSSIDALPSLPSVYKEIIEEVNSENGSLEKIGEIISRDAGMSAKLLQLVSSAFFGLPEGSKSIARAVNMLGIETIKTLVLSVNIFSQYERPGLALISKLWDHSLGTGMIAKSIARSQKLDQDEPFLAGLLHDVGKLILLDKLPQKYEEALNLSEASGCPLWEAEQTVLGTTHAQIGAYLMGIWGLSGTLVEAIAFHHCPGKSSNSAFTTLTAVHLADWAQHSGRAKGRKYGLDMEYLKKLGVSEKLYEHFITEPDATEEGQPHGCKSFIC
ncbi:MAG: HDOD domain-containing protein [Syntrophobacteraceae bacterium]